MAQVANVGSGCRGLGHGERGAGVGSTRDEAEVRAGGRVRWVTATSAVVAGMAETWDGS